MFTLFVEVFTGFILFKLPKIPPDAGAAFPLPKIPPDFY